MDLKETEMSYDEWKDAGYYVRKGEKSRSRDLAGVCQFTLDQVIGESILRKRRQISELSAMSQETPDCPLLTKFWSIHDTSPDLSPNLLPTQERMSYLASSLNPNHQIIRSFEAHCESVRYKHHGHLSDEYYDNY